jgi:hypothetical protein
MLANLEEISDVNCDGLQQATVWSSFGGTRLRNVPIA